MLTFLIGVIAMAALTFWKTDWYKDVVKAVVWLLDKIVVGISRAATWLEERYLPEEE